VIPFAPVSITPSLYHWFPDAEEEVKTTLEPSQTLVFPAVVTTGAGTVVTVTETPADAGELQVPDVVFTV